MKPIKGHRMPLLGSTRRFRELDALRGVAALWVVIYHYTSGVQFWLPQQPLLVAEITPWSYNVEGWYAVHLFFIISGFVITMTIERCRNVQDFVVSRFARLYPTYWTALTISGAAILVWPLALQHVTLAQILVNFSMLNLFVGVGGVDTVYWSLAFEMGFYVLAGITLAAGAARHAEVLGACWVLVALLLLRLLPHAGLQIPWRVQAATALPYAGLFTAGLIFYRIWTRGINGWRIAVLGLCYLQRVAAFDAKTIIFTTIFFAIFILCVSGWATFLQHHMLLWLGAISYPLYLIHAVIGIRLQLALHALGLPAWPNLVLSAGVALGLAWAISSCIERPAGRFIRNAVARWSAKVATAPIPTGAPH
jgi:peptidoglycan/LPS O-acetylase OafA/YrhL